MEYEPHLPPQCIIFETFDLEFSVNNVISDLNFKHYNIYLSNYKIHRTAYCCPIIIINNSSPKCYVGTRSFQARVAAMIRTQLRNRTWTCKNTYSFV